MDVSRMTTTTTTVVAVIPEATTSPTTTTATTASEEEEPELNNLPDDLAVKILSFLDVPSLVRQRQVNRSFCRIASQNSLWTDLCRYTWKNKIHVSRQAQNYLHSTQENNNDNSAMNAFRIALEDAKTRDHVTLDELCYDPDTQQGTIWSLRFKEAAGPDWTSWDPWWNYDSCRKMVFLRNGQVKMYVPRRGNDDSQQQQQQRQSPTHQQETTTSTTNNDQDNVGLVGMEPADFHIEQQDHDDVPENEERMVGELTEPTSPMTWRFITEPLDLPEKPLGSYIRLRVGGRDVPTYCCRRSPTGNWGFVMESCWGVCGSFELPPRPKNTRHRRVRRRLRRAHNLAGNETYVHVNVDESSEDETVEEEQDRRRNDTSTNDALIPGLTRNDWGGVVRKEDLLIADSSFNITISLQWREAFLYNVGEDSLPEGPDALSEFQRVYDLTMR